MAEELAAAVAHSGCGWVSRVPANCAFSARRPINCSALREALENDVAERVREARASLEEERSRLAALMADLSQSVVVCNLDGRVLLYNQRAKQELSAGRRQQCRIARPRTFDLHGVRSGADRACARTSAAGQSRRGDGIDSQKLVGSAQFVTATRAGRLLRAHMSPVLGGDGPHHARGRRTFDYRFRARS
jgi:DNA polymerase-3 subunit epsilon